jgi:hypothetical protein
VSWSCGQGVHRQAVQLAHPFHEGFHCLGSQRLHATNTFSQCGWASVANVRSPLYRQQSRIGEIAINAFPYDRSADCAMGKDTVCGR